MGVCSVDESPHIVAIDASFTELVDEYSPVEKWDGDRVGDVHLRADCRQWSGGLQAAVAVCRFGQVDIDARDLIDGSLACSAQFQRAVDGGVQETHRCISF